MSNARYRPIIAELSESEGVFTTAQAERMGVPRDALHDAVESGLIERIARGAYRMVGSGSSFTDELAAIWKLTAPEKFTHERLRAAEWDGVVIGGSSAASILDIGDFHLSPYRIYAPRRINSRNNKVRFVKRLVVKGDVRFVRGLPVTRAERTIFDLVMDNEDLSLVADAMRDAWQVDRGFDFRRLAELLRGHYGEVEGEAFYQDLLVDASLTEEGLRS